MYLDLPADQWRSCVTTSGAVSSPPEERPVYPRKLRIETFLIWCGQDDDAATLATRETPFINKIVVQADQRTPQLTREAIVLCIGRSPQIVLLDDKQCIPTEAVTHERNDTSRYVRVSVDARARREVLDVRTKL